LRTQQLVAFETGVVNTVDPLGGSHVIEALTDELEKRVNIYLAEIERRGGVVSCIESGYIQGEIAGSAYAQQRAIESGEQIVVGVNKFTESQGEKVDIHRVPESLAQTRIKEVTEFRSRRDTAKAKVQLEKLESAARANTNTVPLMIEAVEAGCTLGEISDRLRSVFGKHTEWTGV
jgi:methylmalonyl-CoA mutase N-terminal domain/subunit